jgi:Asp-tRNA(Asn)/Glu-tRNA(Gln) amidotransferase A subunit family amidase
VGTFKIFTEDSLSLPVGSGLCVEGLLLGLQVIGRAFDEETRFSVAQVIEQTAPKFWCRRNGGRDYVGL